MLHRNDDGLCYLQCFMLTIMTWLFLGSIIAFDDGKIMSNLDGWNATNISQPLNFSTATNNTDVWYKKWIKTKSLYIILYMCIYLQSSDLQFLYNFNHHWDHPWSSSSSSNSSSGWGGWTGQIGSGALESDIFFSTWLTMSVIKSYLWRVPI